MTDSHETWVGGFDTLVNDSNVRLFGREMWDIILNPENRRRAYMGPGPSDLDPLEDPPAMPSRLSKNNLLVEQLAAPDAILARIYCFSFQNQMFDLAKPAIFLVHGRGTPIEFPNEETGLASLYLRKLPALADRSGVAGQKGSFAPDLKVWLYDRADFSIRLDTETGSFEQILLDYELGGGIDSGSMKGADTDEVPRPSHRRRRFRRWRSGED